MFRLEFDDNFDAIICLNATIPPLGFFLKLKELPIIAADGGAIQLFKIGVIPDFVVGDLDTFYSSGLAAFFESSTIIEEKSQDLNDFEKSLIFARSKNLKNLLIVGFHGGELEHTLNNWSVVLRYANDFNVCIFDNNRYAIPLTFSCSFKTKTGELITLIPQPSVQLTTKNLHWNLNNELLSLGTREGLHNIAEGDEVELVVHNGSVLLFIDQRLPNCFRKINL